MFTEDELFQKVEEAINAVLDTAEGEIKKESMFKADLDAESIDYLDISFEIEQRTGIELNFTEALQYITDRKGSEITDIAVHDILDYMMHLFQQKENEKQ